MNVLAANGIGVALGGRGVLADIVARFEPRRVTALLGPNGAGKSTLLACLAALRRPDAGMATLADADVQAIDRRERGRRIGLLPQAGEVHWDIDARTLVGLGRLPHRGRWGETAADLAAIDRAMVVTDTVTLADRGVERLSGGERARVLLARVLAGEPEWLLADEPLAGLDPAHQLDVLSLLRAVAAAGSGVIVVLHDLALAARVADDVVLLRDGRLIAVGPVDEVLTAPLIRATFDVEVEIGRTASGVRFILPVARAYST